MQKKSLPPSRLATCRVEYEISAGGLDSCPIATLPEVALIGRSNAGKSSFINALAGRSVARVSQKPGHTRVLNFFRVNERYRLVDMPGYGFSKRSGSEQKGWQKMVESYLGGREALRGLILIMDVRREWEVDEQQMLDFALSRELPVVVVLNKVDKLKQGEAKRVLSQRSHDLQIPCFAVSALDKLRVMDVEDFVFRQWVRDSKVGSKVE